MSKRWGDRAQARCRLTRSETMDPSLTTDSCAMRSLCCRRAAAWARTRAALALHRVTPKV